MIVWLVLSRNILIVCVAEVVMHYAASRLVNKYGLGRVLDRAVDRWVTFVCRALPGGRRQEKPRRL